jgi:hypothetical protein
LNTEFKNLHIYRIIYIMREILKGGKLGFRRTAGDVTLQGSHRRNDKSPGLL